jgi:hypothetical protein
MVMKYSEVVKPDPLKNLDRHHCFQDHQRKIRSTFALATSYCAFNLYFTNHYSLEMIYISTL